MDNCSGIICYLNMLQIFPKMEQVWGIALGTAQSQPAGLVFTPGHKSMGCLRKKDHKALQSGSLQV